MAVKMRLTRLGDKKSPFYRIVVVDSRKARDGQYVDLIGTYDPLVRARDGENRRRESEEMDRKRSSTYRQGQGFACQRGYYGTQKILCEKTQAGSARAQKQKRKATIRKSKRNKK